MRCDVMSWDECSKLAEIAAALVDAGGADAVCKALASGQLTATSTSARYSAIALGNRIIEARLRDLQGLWRRVPEMSGSTLSMLIWAAVEATRKEQERAAQTEVIWTGPRAETSYLRATRQVVLDLLRNAKDEVLVVGYWIAADAEPNGVVRQIISQVAQAARRGALVKVVLDRTARPRGGTNRDLFLFVWPADIDPPALFTWKAPESDVHPKLHAKVIVADRRDALVTSANLTMHAMDLNMEMGVRVAGAPARSIADHFDRLIAMGTLEPYEAE